MPLPSFLFRARYVTPDGHTSGNSDTIRRPGSQALRKTLLLKDYAASGMLEQRKREIIEIMRSKTEKVGREVNQMRDLNSLIKSRG